MLFVREGVGLVVVIFIGVLASVWPLWASDESKPKDPFADCRGALRHPELHIDVSSPESPLRRHWTERVLRRNGFIQSKVPPLLIAPWLLRNGHLNSHQEIQAAVDQWKTTTVGTYLVQFYSRLARAVGESHHLDPLEAEAMAGAVFIALLNPKFPAQGGREKKIAHFQRDQFLILPTFQVVETYLRRSAGAEPDSLWPVVGDGLAEVEHYLRGIELRPQWEASIETHLDFHGLYGDKSWFERHQSRFQLNEFRNNQLLHLFSQWNQGRRWDLTNPMLPFSRGTSAAQFLTPHMAQQTFYGSECLGGMVALHPSLAQPIREEVTLFQNLFDDFLKALRSHNGWD